MGADHLFLSSTQPKTPTEPTPTTPTGIAQNPRGPSSHWLACSRRLYSAEWRKEVRESGEGKKGEGISSPFFPLPRLRTSSRHFPLSERLQEELYRSGEW